MSRNHGSWRGRSRGAAPALTRLLSSATLSELTIGQAEQLLDGPSAALLCNALRGNATLTSLSMHADVWRNVDAAAALLGALTAHSSVRTLNFLHNDAEAGAAAVGAALGTIVAANAPALTELSVSHNALGDAGLRPLLEALPANTHLRELDVACNGMSEAFARDVLLPVVRANTSLRMLNAENDLASDPLAQRLLQEAEALVRSRAAAAAPCARH
jgi:hypothetical protein